MARNKTTVARSLMLALAMTATVIAATPAQAAVTKECVLSGPTPKPDWTVTNLDPNNAEQNKFENLSDLTYPARLHDTKVWLYSDRGNASIYAKAERVSAGDILSIDRLNITVDEAGAAWPRDAGGPAKFIGMDLVLRQGWDWKYCEKTATSAGSLETPRVDGAHHAIRVCLRHNGGLQCTNVWYADNDDDAGDWWSYIGSGGTGTPSGNAQPIGSAPSPGVRGGGTVADLTGDGKADVIAVYGDDMYLYPGNGHSLGSRSWLGNGWSGFATINVADLTGDGKADVIATTSGGDMYLYASNGAGLGNRAWLGHGWGAGFATINAGDLTGDGRADIIATTTGGDMYLYASNGQGLVDRYWLGSGWTSGFANLNAGDLTGDGKADIIAITTGGDMYVYPSNGTALNSRYFIGNGWTNGVSAVDFGDITGDRKADAVMATSNGDMHVHPSNGTALGQSYWIGSGWSGYRIGG